MRGKRSKLSSLKLEELLDLRKEKVRQQIASAHKQAGQSVERAPRPIRAMKTALGSTGAAAGDPKLEAEIRQIGKEINRRRKESERRLARVSPGELQRMAGEALAQDLRRHEEMERAVSTKIAAENREQPKTSSSEWYKSSSDIVRRRQIVLSNPSLPAARLCRVFDSNRIPLPGNWETELNVATWAKAYMDKTGRARIQRIISTDRRT